MATIVKLQIKNFRGIKSAEIYPNQGLNCLVGRGDSGKTTVLEAIALVLSPSWSVGVNDSDFYNGDPSNNPIEVCAHLIELPDQFLLDSKYGLYCCGYKSPEGICAISHGTKHCLKVCLKIGSSLEPEWTVVNENSEETKSISASDRSLFNCFMIADYIDQHFLWSKGAPLYALLRGTDDHEKANEILRKVQRDTKEQADTFLEEQLNDPIRAIKTYAADLGLNLSDLRNALDGRDVSMRGGRIALHDSEVPMRLKGNGSKRLASMAIQMALAEKGGILLVDEIEQGLEPDRVKQVAKTLKEDTHSQIFLTSHSIHSICELEWNDLSHVARKTDEGIVEARALTGKPDDIQGTVRECPEAFYLKKIILCEGSTEVGFCRSIEKVRKIHGKANMSFLDCGLIDGKGSSHVKRAKAFLKNNLSIAIFCDSDIKGKVSRKNKEELNPVATICDMEEGLYLEQQVFKDVPKDCALKLIEYAMINNKSMRADQSILKCDSPESRDAVAALATNGEKPWFKSHRGGEALGYLVLEYYEDLDSGCRLKAVIDKITEFIEAT